MSNEGIMALPIPSAAVPRAARERAEEPSPPAPPVRTVSFLPAPTRGLFLLLAFLILYSIILASSDSHPYATYKAKCILCQLNHDLSCTKEAKSFLLPLPVYRLTIFAHDDALAPCGPPVFQVGSRGPPRPFSGFPG